MAPPSFGVCLPPPTTRQWNRWPRRRSTQPDMPRPTTESLRRASTLFLSHDAPVGYVLQTVSSYNLQWLVLRNWLLERFKDHPQLGDTLYKNQVRVNIPCPCHLIWTAKQHCTQEGKEDRFHFHIPRNLTEVNLIRRTYIKDLALRY